jgi:hypothetical protein
MPVQRDAGGVIVNADELTVDDVVGNRVRCPACGNKIFKHWPFGWDAHSAHRCAGLSGATVKDRKKAFKEMFSHLFR